MSAFEGSPVTSRGSVRERRSAWTAVWTVAAGVVLAACGGSSTAGGGSSGAFASNRVADQAASTAAVLKLSDFPTGWTSSARSQDPSVPGVDRQLAQCLHVSVALLNQSDPSNVDSPDFNDANGATVDDSVSFAPSTSDSQKAFTALSQPQVPQCLSSALNSYIAYSLAHPKNSSDTVPPGVSIGSVVVTHEPFPTVGSTTVAYRVIVPVKAAGQQLSIYVDFVVSVQGRGGSILTAENIGSPLDSSLEQQLQSAVIGRMHGG